MAVISGGELVLADTVPTYGASTTYYPSTGLSLTNLFSSYGTLYKKQLWVYSVVRKRAKATARLPLKVYRRAANNSRDNASGTPYGRLLARPNPRLDPFYFWEWSSSTADVYGEFIWLKVRGRDGRPAELWPIHPSNITIEVTGRRLDYVYTPATGSQPRLVIPEQDVVHYRTYNPDSTTRGLSPAEPLRQTLINEDAARRSNSAFWRNGARPSMFLSAPGKLSTDAKQRLKAQWDAIHGGVDNFGKTAVLEEGIEPKDVSMSAEDSQYIEARKLNREEVCAAYDVPPPVVHILDHATYSNITEQMRSMYRDTMAPHLGAIEAVLEQQLRPDFGDDDVYAEFLMDEVLRGSFEARQEAYAKADYMTIAEKRAAENLPHVDGTDRILINGTYRPLDNILADPVDETTVAARALDAMWGRLGTCASLDEVDADTITAGLNGKAAVVRSALAAARDEGESIGEFRARLRAALA